jgi:hypothetical protein
MVTGNRDGVYGHCPTDRQGAAGDSGNGWKPPVNAIDTLHCLGQEIIALLCHLDNGNVVWDATFSPLKSSGHRALLGSALLSDDSLEEH